MKRFFDVVISVLALIVLAPVFALIALAVRLSMGPPVLFRQVRSGYRGRPFVMCKFRTMRDAETNGGRPTPDARRLTRLGRFLRAASLDELPELWNVLKGDMSLVGPRPLLPQYLPLYSPGQARRHEVKPGITGWAQVNGRNAIGWDEKLALDVWYVDHGGLWLDLKIILLTFSKVLVREGIDQAEGVTMEPFRGAGGPVAADEDDQEVPALP